MGKTTDRMSQIGVGIFTAVGIALATANLKATLCEFSCGECSTIIYYGCSGCAGSGCNTVGYNCEGACWICSSGGNGCAS